MSSKYALSYAIIFCLAFKGGKENAKDSACEVLSDSIPSLTARVGEELRTSVTDGDPLGKGKKVDTEVFRHLGSGVVRHQGFGIVGHYFGLSEVVIHYGLKLFDTFY